MKSLSLVAMLLVAAACSTTSSTETVDTLAVELDTVTIPDILQESDDNAIEWITTELEFENTVSGFQYAPMVAYNYRKGGLPLYSDIPEDDQAGSVVETLEYGARIELVKELINSKPDDKIIVDGLKGRYIEVKRPGGIINYVFSGYLSNVKVPELNNPDNLSAGDYFSRSFTLMQKPVKKSPRDTTNEETKYSYETNYVVEGDMHVLDHGYYEGGGQTVTLPKNATMQEAWLILTSFELHAGFKQVFPEFPTKSMNEITYETNITKFVNTNDDGEVVHISVELGQGCSDSTFITMVDGRIQIGQDGGC